VVAHNGVNLVWEFELVADDIEEQPVREATTVFILRASVYYLVEDYVRFGVVGKVGKGDYSLEVAPVAVQVAGEYDFACGGQIYYVAASADVVSCRLFGLIEQLDYCLRHSCSI